MSKFVRDIMKIGVPTCETDTPLTQIAKIMARDNADAVVVMDEVGSCGVVSQSDLVRAYPRNFDLLTAKDVMTSQVITVPPDAAATAVAHMMMDEKVHQVFVLHEHPGAGKPSAVVTMRAIVREMAGLEPDRPAPPLKRK
ncbi:hypothetical protein ANRL3_02424 [Anaerolineae bacterium]|nr:hypothetical protein ANRL3_02424 [Anaerolineae bacterium]